MVLGYQILRAARSRLTAWMLIGGWIAAATVAAAPASAAATGHDSLEADRAPLRPIEQVRVPPIALAVADPVRRELDALAATGRLPLPEFQIRPLGRYRLALTLARAASHEPGAGEAPTVLYARLPAARRSARTLLPELDTLDAISDSVAAPLPASLRIHPALIETGDAESRLRIEAFASFQAEAAPERGFVLTDSTRLGLRLDVTFWKNAYFFSELYVADVPGGRDFGDPLAPDTDIIIYIDRAYAAFHTRIADITFGRDRQGWGPGRVGTLLLSDTARPFTHLRLSRSFLDGRLNAVIENGVLSGVDDRYIAYHRLDWWPSPSLRIGLAEGARYDNDTIEPLYLLGIIPYTLVDRIRQRDSSGASAQGRIRNNVMWDLDTSWRPRSGSELYGELLIDDIGTETSQTPTRLAYQLGAYQVGALAGRELRLRFEWTRVWRWVYTVFYDADFIHQGVSLGYPLGPDSRHVSLRGDWLVRDPWMVGFSIARQDRGENRIGDFWNPDDPQQAGGDASQFQGIVEQQWQFLGTGSFIPSRHIETLVELGVARVTNAAHRPGVGATGLLGRVSLRVQR